MKCESCGREGAYIRFVKKEVACKLCGHVSPLKAKAEKQAKEAVEKEFGAQKDF